MLSKSKEQMTNEGFICISRGIREHWVWNNPVFFKRWVELIMMANYDSREVSFSFCVLVPSHVGRLMGYCCLTLLPWSTVRPP